MADAPDRNIVLPTMDHFALIENPVTETADWSRELPRQFWDPGRKLLLTIRGYQRWQGKSGIAADLLRKWLILRHRFWSVVTGADIPLNCNIGGGLLIPHPNGIVIHPDARIGVNCLVFQQVTIGTRNGVGLPRIERPCRYWRRGQNPGTCCNRRGCQDRR